MAYKQVGIVEAAPQETVIQRRQKGWAKNGQLAGAAVGGVVGAMAGGPAGAMAGASAGASLGGMVGDRLRPGREEKTAIERRAAAAPQMIQSDAAEKLKQSISALATQPPEMQQQYMKPLIEAYAQTVGQKQGGGMA